ncbi:cytochrome P450 [Mycena galericulata]|nr:cytochrome P450 [Mycena galericulata]
MISKILFPLSVTLLFYLLLQIFHYVYGRLTHPLRHIGGPRNPSFILGNFKKMADDTQLTDKWRDEFGRTFKFNDLFSISHFHTSDIKALTHILSNSSIYQRATLDRNIGRRLFGDGLIVVETDVHKRQVSNPAFGGAQIRLVTETFIEAGERLRDTWATQVAQEKGAAQHIDVSLWLRRITLDIIGKAGESLSFYMHCVLIFEPGFNYEFDAMQANGKSNKLNDAFTNLLHSPNTELYAGFRVAQSLFPLLRLLPVPGAKVSETTHDTMFDVGSQIVSESKRNLKDSEGEKALSGQRDLLSVMIKANVSTDLPESQRLSDDEVIARIPGFLLAGHETTSSAVSWALNELSLNAAIQSKLREELFTISTERPTMDELNSLPYLDSVVREILRMHAPVAFVKRMAMQDDVLPLSEPYIDTKGKSHDSLLIPKGQIIHIPILAVNTDKEIWGEDAMVFRPERWQNIPEAVNGIPGVWGNLLTFLAGPHNCIGFRFSVIEFKVLLFVLVRAFEFEPAVPKGDIVAGGTVLRHPTVRSGTDKSSSLPLILKPYEAPAY